MPKPLHVAFLWHMHQPCYLDLENDALSLPWVRLHGTKDYLHMLEVLQDYPEVHVTFNMVPSLTEQLEMYAVGEVQDKAQIISRRQKWTDDEKQFLLSLFFHINWYKVIRKYPAYWRLLQLRQIAPDAPQLFSDGFYRDLIAWFNLAWIDPGWLEKDPALSALVDKGSGYHSRDIEVILEKHREIIGRILPTYRRLLSKGQIEISTTPYYHPILPLLIDSRAARRPSSDLPLPSRLFSSPEDAEEQVRRAVVSHKHHFGCRPAGMWPSEGAVSPEILDMLRQQEFTWLASDEAILAQSLGLSIDRDDHAHVLTPEVLYQPYFSSAGGEGPAILFRDNVLSDRIGFVYQHMSAENAVNDLMLRLYVIRDKIIDKEEPYLVSIILDGENCWEEYERNGDPFLRRLYDRLSGEKDYIRSVTVSEYLEQFPVRKTLPRLATGSWIGGNLKTWIGEPAQNLAWEYLARTRDQLVAFGETDPRASDELLRRAWESLYIAEGSDWFWWYYSRNNLGEEDLFDQEFRRHLRYVYTTLGLPVPDWLKKPIPMGQEETPRMQKPEKRIQPSLTAAEALPAEWGGAGFLDAAPAGGAMQRADTVLKRIYFGGSADTLYLRVEGHQDFNHRDLVIYLSTSSDERMHSNPMGRQPISLTGGENMPLHWAVRLRESDAELLKAAEGERWERQETTIPYAGGLRVREVGIPLRLLELKQGNSIGVIVTLCQDDRAIEIIPREDHVEVELL